jgi:dienelactone hydrolase
MMKKLWVPVLLLCVSGCGDSELPERHGKTDGRLYLGEGSNQPLIVGFGGGEGGNAWDSDRWASTRDKFLKKGYAFLALEYFGGTETPGELDRISLEGIHDAILEVARNPKIDGDRICLVGASKGAELALVLASHYTDINCVVAIVPCHAAFPALTLGATTSSWTYQEKEVPFVPMPWAAVPAATAGNLREAFTIMLKDSAAVEAALIPVEKIRGPLLLVSATRDEMWPSKEMSDLVMAKLKQDSFQYPYEHIVIEGGHAEPLNHFDEILLFLNEHF